LPGVGPKKADILQKEAGISSYEDLLFYFPYKYIDRSRFYKVAEISGNMPYIQLKGQILYFDTLGEGRSKRLVGKFSDGTGTIDLVWFKGLNYVTDKYRPNTEYIVFGKPTEFGHTYNKSKGVVILIFSRSPGTVSIACPIASTTEASSVNKDE
jgi:ATP-dependent DNA helicase RecG